MAKSSDPRAAGGTSVALSPRLLRDRQAADYLGLSAAAVRRITAGRVLIDGHLRWDRHALDAWLDGESGLRTPAIQNGAGNAADDALEAWLAGKKNAARRT
jgi:hypothetical protein